MRKVGRLLEDATLTELYVPLLKRQRKGDTFAMRISVCFLYADIYDRFDADMQEKIRKKIVKLAKDDTPMVRRGAA